MKTLRVTLADILGPAGPAGRVSGEVWARFVGADGQPRTVRYTDGTVVVLSKPRKSLNSDGYVDFDVVPNDDATVHADDQGFGIRVGWDLKERGEHGRSVDVRGGGIVEVVTADPAIVQFGLKAAYVPIIPGASYPTSGDVSAAVAVETAARVASMGGKVDKVGGRTRSAVTASGSGGASNAAAINAELASLSTFGGGVLELAGGLHDNLSTITVPAYCTLSGTGWSVTDQGKGTVLRFAAGQDGVVLAGQASRIEGMSVISKDNGVAGSSVGVTIGHLHCTIRDVNIGLFGSHGIKCDSTGGGARNEARIDNVRAYSNAGCGLFIDGSDSNSGWVTALDLTGNKGAAQLYNEGSRWIIWAHIDSAGVGGATDAVWDNAIANTYNVYVEASAAPGSNFHLGSTSIYGTVEALTYAKPIIVADVNTSLLSWRIYEDDAYRFLKIKDTYGSGTGKSWRLDSGIAAAGRLRIINTTDSRTAMEFDGAGTYISFAQPPIPSPDNGVDLGRTSNRWRNQFLAGYVEIDELAASPAAPAANKARLFVKDNGAGKTQLVVRFPTGAETVLATEP